MVTMSGYRKIKKPLKEKSEEEFVLELCNIFSACCIEAAGKQQFLEFEGVELMLIMLKNRQSFRIGCIKVSPGHVLLNKPCTLHTVRYPQSLGDGSLDCRCLLTPRLSSSEHLISVWSQRACLGCLRYLESSWERTRLQE